MAETKKTIIKIGNSNGMTIDSKMTFASGIGLGDTVVVKCSPNKIVLVKSDKKGE
jgi:antitoxin component of MazEF toxin-antitoxin module